MHGLRDEVRDHVDMQETRRHWKTPVPQDDPILARVACLGHDDNDSLLSRLAKAARPCHDTDIPQPLVQLLSAEDPETQAHAARLLEERIAASRGHSMLVFSHYPTDYFRFGGVYKEHGSPGIMRQLQRTDVKITYFGARERARARERALAVA